MKYVKLDSYTEHFAHTPEGSSLKLREEGWVVIYGSDLLSNIGINVASNF